MKNRSKVQHPAQEKAQQPKDVTPYEIEQGYALYTDHFTPDQQKQANEIHAAKTWQDKNYEQN